MLLSVVVADNCGTVTPVTPSQRPSSNTVVTVVVVVVVFAAVVLLGITAVIVIILVILVRRHLQSKPSELESYPCWSLLHYILQRNNMKMESL